MAPMQMYMKCVSSYLCLDCDQRENWVSGVSPKLEVGSLKDMERSPSHYWEKSKNTFKSAFILEGFRRWKFIGDALKMTVLLIITKKSSCPAHLALDFVCALEKEKHACVSCCYSTEQMDWILKGKLVIWPTQSSPCTQDGVWTLQ